MCFLGKTNLTIFNELAKTTKDKTATFAPVTEKDKAFIKYWEQNRSEQSSFISKLLRGLPMAIIFALPIILSVVVVLIFFPDWYMKISKNSSGAFITVVVAMIITVVFYSWFRMHYKWEMNEQLYKELKAKENKTNNTGFTNDKN